MKRKTGKRRFKKGDAIKSQLPPKNRETIYYIKSLTDTEYVLCDWPSKQNPERIPFKYIEGACIIDDKRVYNYVLYMEEKDAKNVQKRDQAHARDGSSEQRRSNDLLKRGSSQHSQSGSSTDNGRKRKSRGKRESQKHADQPHSEEKA